MSSGVFQWVLQHSEEKMGRRLTLLALADHANGDGTGAWPSVAMLARETRLSERQVQYCLRGLQTAGAIKHAGNRDNGTRIYDVVMAAGVQNLHPGADDDGVRVPNAPPEVPLATGKMSQIAPELSTKDLTPTPLPTVVSYAARDADATARDGPPDDVEGWRVGLDNVLKGVPE